MAIKIDGLSAIRAQLQKIRAAVKIPTIFIVGLPVDEEQKIKSLVHGNKSKNQPPRDFLKITQKLGLKMAAAFLKAAVKNIFKGSLDAAWQALGEVYLKAIQDRIGFSGGDLNGEIAPLAESTIAQKGHNRLFYNTGSLYRAILKARVELR